SAEQLVGLHGDEAITIARRAAVGARLSLARHAHSHAVVNPGGNGHRERDAAGGVAGPAALDAGVGHHGAHPAATGAGGLHPQDAGRLHHLAVPAAAAAGFALGAGLLARTLAVVADLVAVELDRLGDSGARLLEIERHVGPQVGPAAL